MQGPSCWLSVCALLLSLAAGALALTWFHALGCPPSPCFNKTQSLYDFLSTEIISHSEEKLAALRLHCALGVPSAPAATARLPLGLQGALSCWPGMAGMPEVPTEQLAQAGRWPGLHYGQCHSTEPQGEQGQDKREEKGKKARSKVLVSNDQFTCSSNTAGAGWHCCVGTLSHPCSRPPAPAPRQVGEQGRL